MTTPNSSHDRFVRLSRPAIPLVRFTAQLEPDGPTAATGAWERLSRPAVPVVALAAEPGPPGAAVVLRRPLGHGDDPRALERRLHVLAEKVGELVRLEGGPVVRRDDGRSGVRGAEIVLVLTLDDPDRASAVAVCKRVANILFNASPGVNVAVFAPDPAGEIVYLAV